MASDNSPPSGMRDLLPQQVILRDWATSIIADSYRKFGFTRIETPVMENIELLRGGEGGENLQLIFEVLKRGEKFERALSGGGGLSREELVDLGLRFDLTVPLVRYYCGNEANLPKPFKSLQIGPVFRAESPQKGRFRQFTQCDIDIIGAKSEIAETELMAATSTALLALGFENFSILINDRRFLSGLAEHCGFAADRMPSVFIALDKLDKIGLESVRDELLADNSANPDPVMRFSSMFEKYLEKQKDGKVSFEEMQKIFPDVFQDEFMKPLQNVIEAVSSISRSRFQVRFDPTLVRGMGYYTGQIFEVKYPGYSGSIAGGGRYDKMVAKFGGRETPACGFSIGFERVIDILSEKGFKPPLAEKMIALIVDPDRDSGADVLKAAAALRAAGNLVSITPRKKELKKQLDALKEQGYSLYCAYRGDPDNLYLKSME